MKQACSPGRYKKLGDHFDSAEFLKGQTESAGVVEDDEMNYESIEFDSALEVDIEEMIDVDEGIGPQRAGRLSETQINKMKHAFKSQSLSGARTHGGRHEPKFANGIIVSQINLRAVQTNTRPMNQTTGGGSGGQLLASSESL